MATLSCSQHTAYIQGKCNGPRLCELLNTSHIYYDRRLDDISEAYVDVSISGDADDPCCACLSSVEPWCHVLTIVREGDGVVWTGPVQRVIYGYDSVRIEAKDKLAWLQVRVNELPIDYSTNTTVPMTTIASEIARIAMADDGDSPCFMDCVLDLGDGLPAVFDRQFLFPAYEGPTAFDDFTTMSEAGVDYTVVNQCLILSGAEAFSSRAIGTLKDEHILGDISVIKNGNRLANRWFIRFEGDDDCPGVCVPQVAPTPCPPPYTTCCPCPAVADGDEECYGAVERLRSDLGIQTYDTALQTAQTFLNGSRLTPLEIEFQGSTRLSSETPWEINDMIPGQRVDVALSKLCLPVFQSFKLQQVTVEDTGDGEAISVDLTTLGVI